MSTDLWPRCVWGECENKHAWRSMLCRFHKPLRVRIALNEAYEQGRAAERGRADV